MTGSGYQFTVEIAGVPLEIRCQHPTNKMLMREYWSERRPCFICEPKEEEIRNLRSKIDWMIERRRWKSLPYTDEQLEGDVIYADVANALLDYNVLLMHGSAICMDGNAYIFTAPAGTGKSTHARLWRECFGERVKMINDDKPLLLIKDDGVTVFGSPWCGKHHLGSNVSAPLKAIVHLMRDSGNHITSISKSEAFPVLMRWVLSTTYAKSLTKILPLVRKLLNIVPFYRLRCNMEKETAWVAWRGMNAASPINCSMLEKQKNVPIGKAMNNQ